MSHTPKRKYTKRAETPVKQLSTKRSRKVVIPAPEPLVVKQTFLDKVVSWISKLL